MAFQVSGQDVVTLSDGTARAEIWPRCGGNCLRWSVAGPNGEPLELLYQGADWPEMPTRSGNPVLFPFPNRIRDGRFTWAGQTYALPLNCPQRMNAIHGFACRHPWRVRSAGADSDRAWLTASFRPSIDAPDAVDLWPGDYELTLTITLTATTLAFTAAMENHGGEPTPWGLGYHPYFQVHQERGTLRVPASQVWELENYLPTGRRIPVDAARDLRRPRRLSDLTCDEIYTSIQNQDHFGEIDQGELGRVTLHATLGFREAVVFTPPHRRAVCIEPYTCVTDAVNMSGVDGGWRVLPPHHQHTEQVEFRYHRR